MKNSTTVPLLLLNAIILMSNGVHSFAPMQQQQQQRNGVRHVRTTMTTTTTTQLSYSTTDYAHTIQALQQSLVAAHESLKQLEILTARLVDMEEHAPHMGELKQQTATENPALQQAVLDAKTAIDCHGVTSPEAKQAFRIVDDIIQQQEQIPPIQLIDDIIHTDKTTIMPTTSTTTTGGMKPHDERYTEAALKHHHEYNKIIDQDLLQETMQAVERILAFEHFVKIEQQRVQKIMAMQEKRPQDHTPGMPWGPKVAPQ